MLCQGKQEGFLTEEPFYSSCQIDWPQNIIPIFQLAASFLRTGYLRLWEYLKAELQWYTCSTLDEWRDRKAAQQQSDRPRNILTQLTPEFIASLAGWDLITNAILSASSYRIATNI
ncbi:hypothetical protein [Brasilonema sp. UFV-L1]|uniref:hypothetical protein n=1 Tax=Brasilonema sp. UFV-L1 TaxID=2234130 RepID=UPI00145EED15|nr:hypothetical protein [Brasilonema sp. UFV-L1]NMG11801.1 hypothetical protein [Brasilonema sp. UFV-L1]